MRGKLGVTFVQSVIDEDFEIDVDIAAACGCASVKTARLRYVTLMISTEVDIHQHSTFLNTIAEYVSNLSQYRTGHHRLLAFSRSGLMRSSAKTYNNL